jgi:Mat/Ecp fimbriae major subunit
MKTTTKFIAATVAAAALSSSAAYAVGMTANTYATIVAPITLTQNTALNFGRFSSGSTAGTINHYGQTTGGVNTLTPGHPAKFTVTGTPNTNYTIAIPATSTLTNGAGTQTLTATLAAPAADATNATGVGTFNVTGTLSVPANKPAGYYTGTYNITVNYQ